ARAQFEDAFPGHWPDLDQETKGRLIRSMSIAVGAMGIATPDAARTDARIAELEATVDTLNADLSDLDDVIRILGLESSEKTPAEVIEMMQAEIETLTAALADGRQEPDAARSDDPTILADLLKDYISELRSAAFPDETIEKLPTVRRARAALAPA